MSKGRRREDFRGPDPDVGKATQFKPGQSGNPLGINRSSPIFTARYRALMEEVITPELLLKMGISPKSKYAKLIIGMKVLDAVAINMGRIAITETKFAAISAKEMGDRVEGRAIQRLADADGNALVPPKLIVNFVKRKKK